MWLDRWAHEFRPRGATIEWITEIALDDPEIVEFFEPLRDPETGLVRDPETGRLVADAHIPKINTGAIDELALSLC